MGSSKSTEQTSSGSTQTQTPNLHPIEVERMTRLSNREEFLEPQVRDVQSGGLDLVSQLLGGLDLPGYLSGLPGGIDEGVTQDIVDSSLGDVRAGLQGGGLLDSGVRSELEARTSADIRTQSAQFNLQNLQQLLNLAVGGQAQVQAPIIGAGAQLSQSLAGARGMTTTGTGFSNTTTRNPFLTGADIMGGIGTGIGAYAGLR